MTTRDAQLTTKSTVTAPAPESPGGSASRQAARSAVRGQSFEAGEAALAPRAQPVQRNEAGEQRSPEKGELLASVDIRQTWALIMRKRDHIAGTPLSPSGELALALGNEERGFLVPRIDDASVSLETFRGYCLATTQWYQAAADKFEASARLKTRKKAWLDKLNAAKAQADEARHRDFIAGGPLSQSGELAYGLGVHDWESIVPWLGDEDKTLEAFTSACIPATVWFDHAAVEFDKSARSKGRGE